MKKVFYVLLMVALSGAASAQETKPAGKASEAKKECCKKAEKGCCSPSSKAKAMLNAKPATEKKS